MHSYYVGQQVVCVADKWVSKADDGKWYRLQGGPQEKEIYTISGIRPTDGYLMIDGFDKKEWPTEMGLIIVFRGSDPMCWDHKDFRPVSKRSTETGMAILKKIALTGKLPSRKKLKEAA
jgi:hypothetical protein